MAAAERRFRVMGSWSHVLVVAESSDSLLDRAERRLRGLESTWSRFEEDSELTRLNRSAGGTVTVGRDLMTLMLRSIDAWHVTSGAFDPTLLAAMQQAGYGSIDVGLTDRSTGASCADIALDVSNSTVRLPHGVGIDAGGIGKGLAADIVVEELMAVGAAGALVNVGGDLRLAGEAPTSDGWTVAIEDPFACGRHTAVVRLADGGVATTTPDHRRWRGVDGERRHVIDPSTGEPSDTDVASATVIAATGWMAEALAKAAALATSAAAVDLIDEAGAAGIVVSDSRKLAVSSRMGEFL